MKYSLIASASAGANALAGEQAISAATAPVSNAHQGVRLLNVIALGADPTGRTDASAIFQLAIDALAGTGGIVYIPAGTYSIAKTLAWINPANRRAPGISFQGDSPYSSILRSAIQSGPLLRVRGAPLKGPVSTTFFWGGGIRDLGFEGQHGGPAHDCLEVLGWWHGEIEHCVIRGFSRHGIRAVTDLILNANPDFTASVLSLRGVSIERCGGWGYMDDGGNQGAPAWSWDHCMFVLCRQGGAHVQSSSYGFVKCSFSACGWQSEDGKVQGTAYGLFFTGAVTVASRQWVEGCEFDNNLTAHIGARFLSCSTFINNRFIFNDRYGAGFLCPRSGVELGTGNAKASVRSVEFRQSFFRFDRGGDAIGFHWINTANVRDIDIHNTVFSIGTKEELRLGRYQAPDLKMAIKNLGFRIIDREMPEY